MRVRLFSAAGVCLLSVALVGCEKGSRSTPPAMDGDRRADVDVNTGPGGVDVEVGREGDPKKAVDVDVAPGGGVNVDVDGEKIRERIQERREERQEQP